MSPATRGKAADSLVRSREAQNRLQAKEAGYRDLVENIGSIILRTDQNGNITFFNTIAQNFFGWPLEEIIGH